MRVFAILILLVGLSSQALAAPTSGKPCRMTQGWTTFSANGANLRARTVGSGPPLLVIPSLGRGAADFDALASAIKGHTVVLFDPRWFGESDGPEEIDLFTIADDAAAVLRALCPGQAADGSPAPWPLAILTRQSV